MGQGDPFDVLLDRGGSTEPDPDFRQELMGRVRAALDDPTDSARTLSTPTAEADMKGSEDDTSIVQIDPSTPAQRRRGHRQRRALAVGLVAAVIVALVLVLGLQLAGRRVDHKAPAVSPTNPPPTSAAQSSVVTTAVDTPCPNSDGGYLNHCLGALDPGISRTRTFEPSFSYTVPAGWWNMEDEPGNYLLLPPGGDLANYRTGVGDYLGVYASVAAPAGCQPIPDTSVATTVQAYVDWLQHQASLIVSEPKPIAIGGLSGTQVDVSLSNGPACSDPDVAGAFMPMLIGTNTSLLGSESTHWTHRVDASTRFRLNLFDRPDGTLMVIELADAAHHGGDDSWWTTAAEITNTFAFDS